jgi:baculoviral IAP repeat-containing protein 6
MAEHTKSILQCDEADEYYELSYKNHNFKLFKPNTANKYLSLVSSEPTELEWVTKLNHYSLLNKPTRSKLLKKFQLLADKYIINQGDRSREVIENIDELEVLSSKERHKMVDLVNGSISELEKCNKNDKKYVKKLFTENKVADIVISEYMTLWRYLMSNNSGNIDVHNNSIYHWKLCLTRFDSLALRQALNQINRQYGYNYIEIHIYFDKLFFPNYPPKIKVIRPRLSDSLMTRITNSKQFNLDYWLPTTSMQSIVERLFKIIEKHGKIQFNTDLNNIQKNPLGSFVPIEDVLMDLSSLVDSGEQDVIDTDIVLRKVNFAESKQSKQDAKKVHTPWNAGTGYGHKGANKWNPEEYTIMQEERNVKIQNLFDRITHQVQDVSADYESFYDTLKSSILIKYLKQQLKDASSLEMDKHANTYKKYFTLLQTMCTEYGIVVYHDTSGESLYDIVMKHFEICKSSLEVDDTNEMSNIIFTLGTMLEDVYQQYIKNKRTVSINKKESVVQKPEESVVQKPKEAVVVQKTKEDLYVDAMTPYKFTMGSKSIKNYRYDSLSDGTNLKQCFKRLAVELPSLRNSLSIQYGASIMVYISKSEVNKHRYMITGPVDTPYEHGCFIFDAYMSNTYPTSAPSFKFLNTGDKRFNPNLYNCGKVCLSILGTYVGPRPDPSELWLPKESTLYQVVMSILGQILIEEPYFNEPGYETYRGTPSGNAQNKAYNTNIRLYTMTSTIRDLLQNPESFPEFTSAIKTHFKHKRDDVIKTCGRWVNEANNNAAYTSVFDSIKTLINKL